MPQTKSGFKNWQRITALFLVFIFSAEQVSYAGRLDDAYSSIRSTLKSSVSSAKTYYHSGTQYMRTNFPTAFDAAKPLIAAVDLARSAVIRTPPHFIIPGQPITARHSLTRQGHMILMGLLALLFTVLV